MALTKDQKQSIVSELSTALSESKLTVIAQYKGTPVKEMQELRKSAKTSNTTIKIIKNRLVILALQNDPVFKSIERDQLKGMLLYAFNNSDELASAQTIAKFARTQPNVQIIGAFSNSGEYFSADDAKALANLPTKQQLRGQLVGMLAAPLGGLINVVSGNITGLVRALNARASQIS